MQQYNAQVTTDSRSINMQTHGTHKDSHMHTQAQTHIHTDTHRHTNTRTTHAHTHTHTHVCTRTRLHARTHTAFTETLGTVHNLALHHLFKVAQGSFDVTHSLTKACIRTHPPCLCFKKKLPLACAINQQTRLCHNVVHSTVLIVRSRS